MSKKMSVCQREDSATRSAQRLYGIGSYRESCSLGSKTLRGALTVPDTQTVLTLHCSPLQITLDSHLWVLMKMLFLRSKTPPYPRTCWSDQWQSTTYSLTKTTSSALMCPTMSVHSTTQMRSTWEPSACQLPLIILSGSTATRLRSQNRISSTPITELVAPRRRLFTWLQQNETQLSQSFETST